MRAGHVWIPRDTSRGKKFLHLPESVQKTFPAWFALEECSLFLLSEKSWSKQINGVQPLERSTHCNFILLTCQCWPIIPVRRDSVDVQPILTISAPEVTLLRSLNGLQIYWADFKNEAFIKFKTAPRLERGAGVKSCDETETDKLHVGGDSWPSCVIKIWQRGWIIINLK